MKIETKFNIFDYVYFIMDKRIRYGRVASIIFEEDGAEDIDAVLKKIIPAKRAAMAESNLKALQIGASL